MLQKTVCGYLLPETKSTFQTCIEQIEKGNISATEVATTIKNLLNNLKLKKQERFVTSDVKKQLETLMESGEIDEEKFFDVVESFYDTSLQHADKWICSLGNTDKFKWILLNKTPAWKEIGDSINPIWPGGGGSIRPIAN